MSLMTTLAISGSHICAVRFVALGTLRNFSVYIVAEAAGQLGMLARHLLQFDDLLGMTGQTLIGYVICQFDDFGSMRIIVAAQTAGQVVVRLAGVALATLGNNLFDGRRMACVTILATDHGFVCAAIGCDCFGGSGMTLDAVGTGQHRFLRFSSERC